MDFKCNGWIIQKNIEGLYKGVGGENWFLNYENLIDKEIENYYYEKIDMAWSDDRFVDVSNDFSYIRKCANIAEERGISFRILLCFTEREIPIAEESVSNYEFIGYDYAYSGGSYYSAVENDIISQRIPDFKEFKLNNCGLFDSEETIIDFITVRDNTLRDSPDLYFEEGDFIIYKLYEMKQSKIYGTTANNFQPNVNP